MQSHQLRIDAFCRVVTPVTPAKNDQPAQQAESDNQKALPAPPRRRPRIVDSDSDEGRAVPVMPTPAERADSHSNSSSALQAPAVTSTRADASEAPTQQTTTTKGLGSGQTVSRTIHTETVTQVRIQNVRMHEK
jgi:hypothetical protein